MKLPITKYGFPQVIVYPLCLFGVMLVAVSLYWLTPMWVFLCVQAVLTTILTWILCFFRDPPRKSPQEPELLLSPADGKIADISEIPAQDSPLEAPSLRVGIFLSIFNVHINRMPCAAEVTRVEYRPGKFKNALDPESARLNESNDVYIRRLEEPADALMIRQISGAIARRIVCKARPGKKFSSGRHFGMIKFGSRTELYVPLRENLKCQVRLGDSVKAGLTVIARYKDAHGSQ